MPNPDLAQQSERALLASLLTALGAFTIATPRSVVISLVSQVGQGTVPAGDKYVEFIFSSDFAGTVAGVAYSGANDSNDAWPYLAGADTYGAIAYTITAGSIRIKEVR